MQCIQPAGYPSDAGISEEAQQDGGQESPTSELFELWGWSGIILQVEIFHRAIRHLGRRSVEMQHRGAA